MKNLKNNIKYVIIFFFILLASCQKDEVAKETKDEQPINLADYYIIGRKPAQLSNGQTVQIPYLINFDEYGKANFLRESAKPFTFKDGKIKISDAMVFTIKDNAITAYEDVIKRYPFTSYSLQKKPTTNQFYGNSYQGNWTNVAKTFSVFKFNSATYEEKTGAIYAFAGKYTLLGNIAAISDTEDYAADNFAEYTIVLIDGKLEVTCRKNNLVGAGSETFTYGVFTKVP
ncbi:hypothetical protein [Pedobacter frigoris]|uniref:Lipoprotein n=1 Tax=Pedobacter frigoris TaxID=2571272 RepID=A0A4U1CPX3_9SPHI|nr:hypothetical protein [Pedobacter frigoris]TKC08930.1 hypothetical protein FA047_02205 [Pedobacter frigoris]